MAVAFRGLAFGGVISGGNVTLNLASPNAGSAPVSGDLVLIISTCFGRAGNEGRIGNALSYTQLDDTLSGTQRNRLASKFFVTGETGPVIEASGNAADATGATAVWFSGVNGTNAFSTGAFTQSSGASTNPNAAAITPAQPDCMIVVLAASSSSDAAAGTVTNYTTQATTQGTNDTNSASTAVAYRLLSGGSGVSEDPAAFSAWTTGSWISSTFALRQTMVGAATLGGAGALSANAIVRSPAAATFGGSGGLRADVQQVSAPAAQAGQSESNIFVINYAWPSAPPQFRYLYSQAAALDVSVVWSGQATFNGTGNLSASAKLGAAASGTLQGSGTLSAVATQALAAAATFSGVGTLSADTRKSSPIAATFGGTGSLSALVGQGMPIRATFVGAGVLSAYANLRMVVQATLQGAGSLSVEARVGAIAWTGQATFAGAGSLRADAAVVSGAVAEAYTSFLGVFTPTTYQLFAGLRQSADVRLRPTGEATFGGVGGLSVLANVVSAAVAADAPGESNIFVVNYYWPVAPLGARYNLYLQPATDVGVAGNVWSGEARFAGTGSLSASAKVGMAGAATFAGAGTLSGNITSQGKAVLALLQGVGSLSALTTQQMAALAILNGTGALSADTAKSKDIAATFGGAGSLAAYANLRMVIAATLSGAGSLAVEATITGATNNWSGEARFNGTGGLTVTARLNEAAAATLQGTGSLAAFAGMRLGAAATFSGSGTLSVDVQKLGKAIAATFSGTGGLSARAQVALSASANFGGVGTMSVVMRAAYAASVAFTGTGVMLTTVTQRNVAAAILGGEGTLSADVQRTIFGANAWPGQARFAGRGGLSADAVVVPFVPGPTYDYPIEHALDSDYGIRDAKRRRSRLVIGRR